MPQDPDITDEFRDRTMSRADLDIYVENRALHLSDESYAVARIRERLEADGYVCRTLDRFDPADTGRVAYLHHDLTDTPAWAREIHRHYPVAINGKVASIDRRQYSKVILERSDDYDGPVVVKAILNARGVPELRYAEHRNVATWLFSRFRRWADPKYEMKKCPHYRIFPHKDRIPGRIWKDPARMVEKFIPGTLDLPIIKHRTSFFLDMAYTNRQTFNSHFSYANTALKLERLEGMPEPVMQVRKALHLDVGTIDFFEKDGEYFVIDANKTTQMRTEWLEEHPDIAAFHDRIYARMVELIRDAG